MCLDIFCRASGQCVSLRKSMVFFLKNTSTIIKEKVSVELVIPITEDLRKYLGLATINDRVTKHTFQSISARVNKD